MTPLASASILLSCTLLASVQSAKLHIAKPVALGQPALMNCSTAHSDAVSRIRWYRDGEEFFRYDRRSREKLLFELPGLVVDVHGSHDGILRLARTEPKSEGEFSCEITDSKFHVERADATLQLYMIPDDDPYVRGVKFHYHSWERLNASCELTARPKPQLSWTVNGRSPPTNSVVRENSEEHNGLVSVISRLQFDVSSLRTDQLRLQCRARVVDAFDRKTQRKSTIWSDAKERHSRPSLLNDNNNNNNNNNGPDGDDDAPGPVIYGGRSHYHVGDILNSTCLYSGQKSASLRWYLNGVEVPKNYLLHYSLGGSEAKSALGIRFKIKSSHFLDGRLTIRCDASLENTFATHQAVRKPKFKRKSARPTRNLPDL